MSKESREEVSHSNVLPRPLGWREENKVGVVPARAVLAHLAQRALVVEIDQKPDVSVVALVIAAVVVVAALDEVDVVVDDIVGSELEPRDAEAQWTAS